MQSSLALALPSSSRSSCNPLSRMSLMDIRGQPSAVFCSLVYNSLSTLSPCQSPVLSASHLRPSSPRSLHIHMSQR
ncbi:hypothetical protein BCR37DRAFT_383486 [Protomyces lactucae-debilis]|uniref:Uncharacterized protein n=1 Tax=Protomyces lactucae-debilis TaxID=2754530 RepID=A0A1Y2EZ14_PROLT|nr:uncharacterized protein BCR37DRAFT_383486 [Protomyces lactucae-debilis]ORY76356.1 hypothetical protein BCR37DRAFT_383486 [Protomyces lactucae-debilis]